MESKFTHIREAVDGNNSYDVEPSSHTREDDLVLDTTWAIAMRDGKLKSRLCARDFNNTKRDDLFAPGSQSIASRLVDFRKTRYPERSAIQSMSQRHTTRLMNQKMLWLSHLQNGLKKDEKWRRDRCKMANEETSTR